jgi:lactoylglutathione lyase
MKFVWTTLHISDMERSLHFYRDIVGLPLRRRFSSGDGSEISFLGEGETQVELIRDPDPHNVVHGRGISLGFLTPSLESLIAQLQENGIAIHAGPFQPAPYIRFLYVLDPDGVWVQFVEQVAQS